MATIDQWPELRAKPQPRVAETLLADLRTNKTDLVLIDTPREANNAGYIAARAADFIMIPFKRGGFDFRALKRTLDLCRIANKCPCLLLNGMRVGATRQEADAREALAAYECDVAPVVFELAAFMPLAIPQCLMPWRQYQRTHSRMIYKSILLPKSVAIDRACRPLMSLLTLGATWLGRFHPG